MASVPLFRYISPNVERITAEKVLAKAARGDLPWEPRKVHKLTIVHSQKNTPYFTKSCTSFLLSFLETPPSLLARALHLCPYSAVKSETRQGRGPGLCVP